eukprot:1353538-Amorphochlora_amoeboformis.AAC.1
MSRDPSIPHFYTFPSSESKVLSAGMGYRDSKRAQTSDTALAAGKEAEGGESKHVVTRRD